MDYRSRIALACLLLSGAAGSALGLPPASVSILCKQGDLVGGGHAITGVLGASINNSGVSSVLINSQSGQAVLRSSQGLNPPFLAAWADGSFGDPGGVTVPSTDYVYASGFWTSINNNGDIALSMGLGPNAGAPVTPFTGVYFNKSAIPVRAGDAVTAAGVMPGATFGNFSASGMVKINDNNVVMVAGPIVESGVTKNAIIKLALDGSGGLVSQTLVAKEGGPVGAGPATWAAISVARATCTMNNSGAIMFSGTTSTGMEGIYLNNQFVAIKGGVAPGSQTWASLYGVPLDLSNTGQFAFRGLPQTNPVWTETGDAGEVLVQVANPMPQFTRGSGSLNQINGTLSNDQDVDLYQITIGDPNTAAAQTPFSATTVPNPGSGFAGAGFDSVLYLFEPGTTPSLNIRQSDGRCDDAAPGVMQSTLTTASLPTTHTPGKTYILGISTPKARAMATSAREIWLPEPGRIAVGSTSDMAFWVDAANGQIGRSMLSSATLLSPITVAIPPSQTTQTASVDPNGVVMADAIALYDAGANSKVYFYQFSLADPRIRSCNADGTGSVSNVITAGSAANTVALAVDSVHGALCWSNSSGTIRKSDLNGGGITTIVSVPGHTAAALAVDTSGTGLLYWYDTVDATINSADLTGANIQPVAGVENLTSMTIDPVGQRLYYSSNSGNTIGVIRLSDFVELPPLATPTAPSGIGFDSTSEKVYWSLPLARMLQRSPVSAPSVQNWTSIGADVGERPSYGPGAFSSYSSFVRNGAAGSTPLPYSIKLTGANFGLVGGMICRNNSIIVAQDSQPMPGTPGVSVFKIGTGPVAISDNGVVAWAGFPAIQGAVTTALLANQTLLYDQSAVVGGVALGTQSVGSTLDLTASGNGQHLLAQTVSGAFSGGGVRQVQVDFSSVPGCRADYNGDGGLSVQDIFDFLNGWFAGVSQADFNGSGGLEVQDIFDFLNAWFAGCS